MPMERDGGGPSLYTAHVKLFADSGACRLSVRYGEKDNVEKDYSTFWINGKAWGTYRQRIDENGKKETELNVLFGNIDDVKVD